MFFRSWCCDLRLYTKPPCNSGPLEYESSVSSFFFSPCMRCSCFYKNIGSDETPHPGFTGARQRRDVIARPKKRRRTVRKPVRVRHKKTKEIRREKKSKRIKKLRIFFVKSIFNCFFVFLPVYASPGEREIIKPRARGDRPADTGVRRRVFDERS